MKNLLATASIASVIVGGSNTAFAGATIAGARITTNSPAPVSEGGVNDFWGKVDNTGVVAGADADHQRGPINGEAAIFGANGHIINVDADQTLLAISAGGRNGTSVTLNANLTVGSVVDILNGAGGGAAAGLNTINYNFVAGAVRTLTLNGTGTNAGLNGFTTDPNNYVAFGAVNFENTASILNITPDAPGKITFAKFTVVNGGNAILNINNVGFNTTFNKAIVATAKTINISDGSTVEFNTEHSAVGGNVLQLQQIAGGGINFGTTGNGTLLLTTKAAGADPALHFTVMNDSLGGTKDGEGKIHFNATAVGSLSHAIDADHAVVGIDKTHRAKKFTVTAANAATITGGIYTKELELNGAAAITFNGKIDVGDKGATNIKALLNIALNNDSNLGTTDFYNQDSKITVAAHKTLKGDFHSKVGGVARHGTIEFKGHGELSGTVNNLVAIENNAAGLLKLSSGTGRHIVDELRGTVAGANFEFAEGYKLTGNINETAGIASNLTFKGDAEIIGNIGAWAGSVGDITIYKEKTVIVKGATIKANNIFKTVDGGTLKLTNNSGDVTITSTISANGGGTIDATAMNNGSTLSIDGTIGMDPTGNNNSKALGKLLLKGQNPRFVIPDNKWVNIAGIDFGGNASTVKMNVATNYAFGALTNAEQSTFEVSENVALYNTTTPKDKLKEIKFTADNKTLTLYAGNDITANSITASDGANGGYLVFAGDATLKGDIGTSGRKFSGLKVNAGVKAITSGQGFFNGDIELSGDGSTLVVDNNYTANAVVATVPDKGTLKFVNAAGVGTGVKFTTTAANAGAAIDTLELNGGNVALEGNGIKFNNIKFTSKTAASLTLAPQMQLDGISVVSTFKTVGASSKYARPTVVLSTIDHTISKPNHIGDKDHLVNLQFAGDNILNVATQDFFAGVTTTTDNQGTVNFKAGSDKVYGLGFDGHNLKDATFEVNTENFGDTYVNNGIINDRLKYTAGGTVAGGLQVGSDKGGSVAEFKDGVILTAAMTSKGDDNKINFTNDATISAKLGTENARFKAITFNGNKKASLNNAAMYAEVVNFGTEKIVITGDNNIISGTSHINANIDLNSGKLIFQDNQKDVVSTWGAGISIATTLTADGRLGSIEVNTPIEVAASVPVSAIIVKDEGQLGADQEYKLIANGKNLRLVNGTQFGPLTGVKTDQAYAQWIVQTKDDKDVYLLRSNNAATIAPTDVKAVGGDEKDQENAALLARESDMTDIGRLKEPKERGKAIQQRVNAENALVTDAIDHANVGIANLVGARLAQVDQQKPVGSGSDDVAGESMGAWAMPYYNQAIQKGEGSVVGYKTKSVGGVLGFDALASENLTIGAAVSIVRTDMKYKDYKFGEKTDINTVMLSLYGSQQLDKDFFVQGLVSFGSNKIKNSDPRKVPTSRNASGQQIAKASYDSLSYGGQVLFGYNAKVSDSVLLTPMAGVRYTGSSDEGYKETGTDNANKVVAKKTSNKVEAVLGTRFAVSVDTNGITVMPEAHAFVSQKLVGSSGKVNAKLDGMTSSFATRADKAAKTLFNLGLGVTAKAGNMEYGAGYDAYLASKYVGHQGTLKVRVNF
ncbi:autotransporter outer membrane beta-barrel domain-containing protein [Candidatus Tisiphia endosymbiont of Dioctria rufipes]|uniref:autotransporter outer membrane beta-barrel domain-containing protein n=1 Tax=Candidatus Tisiphia endosymbiont of Dioctria rufipes TaxID=3066255 RepID=UPI00312CB9D6